MTIEDGMRENLPPGTDLSALPHIPEFAPDLDLASALRQLFGNINYEQNVQTPYNRSYYDLERMRLLAQLLGNPHLQYPVIHVAGSKGKGTVSHLVSACLASAGYQVGLYTSPHLVSLHERFRLCGQPVSDQTLLELINTAHEASHQLSRILPDSSRPTFFELTTAMALHYFAQQQVDCAVLEVGLGGRLDSTNICEPTLCVITSIGLDHERQLGSTIAAIAKEKAGIIKPEIPVVCSARHPEARQVIQRRADELGAKLWFIDRDYKVDWFPWVETHTDTPSCERRSSKIRIEINDSGQVFELESCLLGAHQADNIATAAVAVQQLVQHALPVQEKTVFETIASSQPTARLEVLSTDPLWILDTAHNPASMEAGIRALKTHFPARPVVAVFAPSRDKDYRGMLKALLQESKLVVLTQFRGNPRALPLKELRSCAQQILAEFSQAEQPLLKTVDSAGEAWSAAQRWASPDDLLYVTGSFFLASELLPTIRNSSSNE